MDDKLQKIADDLYNTIEASIQKAQVIDGLDVKSARAIVDVADSVITEIEKASTDKLDTTLTGPEKKEVSINVITRLLNFDIPWVPGFLEDKIKGFIINFIIEYAVGWLNKKFGKQWFQ